MKQIFRSLGAFKGSLVLALLGTILGALGNLTLPLLLSFILNAGETGHGSGYVLGIGGGMLLVSVAAIAANVMAAFYSARLSTGFARELRGDIFRRVEDFSQAEFDRFGAASLITRNTNDVLQLQNFLVMFLRVMVQSPVTAIGGLLMAYSKSPGLAMPLLYSIPAILLFIGILSRIIMPIFKVLQKKVDAVNRVLREKLSGIRVIRAFVTETYEEERFDAVNRDLTDTGLKMIRAISIMMPGLMLLMNLTTAFIVWNGGLQAVAGGGVLAGDITAVIQYAIQIMFSLVMMSMVFVLYPRAAASAERIQEVLGTEATIRDPERPVRSGEVRGTVEFKNVTFAFPGAERPALKNISFVSRKGETTAIIGSTGSGKTALLNLIPRFYDVSEGKVLVDGVDVRDYAQADLRGKIGYVPQRAMLFSGTIADNLRYGKENATAAELEEATTTAQAHAFIQEKEGAMDSPVAQGGANFSGGQKQRLSIARALARSPEVYLFDDSFSALDYKTDATLRSALRKKTRESTILVVAQRVSTILHADRIIVLDDGEIAGMGNHDQLMKSCQVYREIVTSQFSDEEVAG